MHRLELLGLALLAAVVLLADPARATLVADDVPGGSADDATFDDVTGLTWYDVNATLGIAFDDAVAVAQGVTGLAWRHATGAEVCALFTRYADPAFACTGDPLLGTSQVAGDISAAFRSLLGPTLGLDFLAGWYDDEDGSDPQVGNAVNQTFFAVSQFTLTSVGPNVQDPGVADEFHGNWLVMVPEPAFAVLLLSGLVFLRLGVGRGRLCRELTSHGAGQSSSGRVWHWNRALRAGRGGAVARS